MLSAELSEKPGIRTSHEPLRIALIGCGAVAQECHLPILAGHERVSLVALVDRNVAAAAPLAKTYGVETVLEDIGQVDATLVDAAIIATPPYHHAVAAIDLMRRGIHVLVEKPMAVTADQADAMIQTAEETGLVLAVGLFRRLLPSSRMMKAILESGALGSPLSFDVEEGHVFNWSCQSLGSMRKDLAGGGVLIDTGSHTLDQLLSFFSGPFELLEYRDNSLGGIESDCLLRLRIEHHGKAVEGRVELSRTRNLRNTFRVTTERATLEFGVAERDRISFKPHEIELVDPFLNRTRDYIGHAGWNGTADGNGLADMRAEIDDWLNAIRTGGNPYLSGISALPTVKLIEECYLNAQPGEESWTLAGFLRARAPKTLPAKERKNNEAVSSTPARAVNHQTQILRRVLVTGASGFIGCRLTELLRFGEGYEVRALIHNPASLGRLSRLPVEMVVGDIRSSTDMARAVDGCDAVVHCAIGTTGNDREAAATTINGTKHLAEAALAAGVCRFVHVSTIGVHGLRCDGDLDETTPIRPARDAYAQSKAEAEKVITQAVARGLPGVILRLANVYGPFSEPYTIRPLRNIRNGIPALVGEGVTPCNTVYVDNAVAAIVRALHAPSASVHGQVFTISDGDELGWADFFGYYARALGIEMRAVPIEHLERLRTEKGESVRGSVLAWTRGVRALLTSTEFAALGRKFLRTAPLGSFPRFVLERFPRFRRGLKRFLKLDGPSIYRKASAGQAPLPPLDLLELYAFPAQVRIDKARRILGYAPVVPRDRAMELTLDWARYARLV